MRTAIVVHGGWHQPQHWDQFRRALQGRGISTVVPDLHELEDPFAGLQDVIDAQSEPPVVIAHSMGGLFASGLERVGHALYVNAFLMDRDETPAIWMERFTTELGGPGYDLPLSVAEDGSTTVAPAAAASAALFGTCSADVIAEAVALLRAEPATAFTRPPPDGAWRRVPSTYVRSTADRVVWRGAAERYAERCGEVVEIPGDHSPYLSQPKLLLDLVERVA